MPTLEKYPRGGVDWEDTYEDDLLGIPMKRHRAGRDYLNRMRLKYDVDELDVDERKRGWSHRVETPDREP